eukprot:227769-Amorphochlora_amoeboformis.AAC.1
MNIWFWEPGSFPTRRLGLVARPSYGLQVLFIHHIHSFKDENDILAGLQVLFGASRLISGLTGTREIVLGGLAYVAVSSQDRHLINLASPRSLPQHHSTLRFSVSFTLSLLCLLHCDSAAVDTYPQASFWFYHFGRDPTTE